MDATSGAWYDPRRSRAMAYMRGTVATPGGGRIAPAGGRLQGVPVNEAERGREEARAGALADEFDHVCEPLRGSGVIARARVELAARGESRLGKRS